MLEPVLKKNDGKAKWLIGIFSCIVFAAIVTLSRFKLEVDLGFNVHRFAQFNALVNSAVTLLLLFALYAVKRRNYKLHRKLMLTALVLSVLFLLSYICHHLFAGETKFGDINHDGIVSNAEKLAAGNARTIYFFLLATHIPLAAIILPFVLFTAYRALISEWPRHKKLARITWPIWLYVSLTGVLVYLFISPYYQ